jgi:hypothetical protein
VFEIYIHSLYTNSMSETGEGLVPEEAAAEVSKTEKNTPKTPPKEGSIAALIAKRTTALVEVLNPDQTIGPKLQAEELNKPVDPREELIHRTRVLAAKSTVRRRIPSDPRLRGK